MIAKNPNNNQIIETLSNPIKQRIIRRLKAKGHSNFGRLIKDLSLSTRSGVMHIVELKNMGIINYVKDTSLIELNNQKLDALGFES